MIGVVVVVVNKGILDTLNKMIAKSPPLWVGRGAMKVFVSWEDTPKVFAIVTSVNK